MLLLGLAGKKGSGKDTVFTALEAWCGGHGYLASRKGFADALKVSAARSLGLRADASVEECIALCNRLKQDGCKVETDLQAGVNSKNLSISGREFLQRYGTEAHRDVFGDNFWVDALLPFGEWRGRPYWYENFRRGGRDPDLAVVTDVRFPNEAARILELGGSIWEVSRPSRPETFGVQGDPNPGPESAQAIETIVQAAHDKMADEHSSEKPLPRDKIHMIIDNSGTLEDLQKMINLHCDADLHHRLKEGGGWA